MSNGRCAWPPSFWSFVNERRDAFVDARVSFHTFPVDPFVVVNLGFEFCQAWTLILELAKVKAMNLQVFGETGTLMIKCRLVIGASVVVFVFNAGYRV